VVFVLTHGLCRMEPEFKEVLKSEDYIACTPIEPVEPYLLDIFSHVKNQDFLLSPAHL